MADVKPPQNVPPEDDETGESLIDQSPRRNVGDRVYVSVPGDVPKVYARGRKPNRQS